MLIDEKEDILYIVVSKKIIHRDATAAIYGCFHYWDCREDKLSLKIV